ncbi:MAG: GTPase [candidate division Zixibacteria bacterium SM23_73_2]|nr:MAG: GTPase [candidate division Zixibacteria bacterium SM23_73_2]
MKRKKILIMGAAGRDFHNFNTVFRDNKDYQVVAFTATQIPNIEGRKYPFRLAGKLYPQGIPILPEKDLVKLIKRLEVDQVVFSYSDISHSYVMHKASTVLAAGADFVLLGKDSTMLKSKKPVVAICATRTGSGKSQTTRKISRILKNFGKKVVVVRHPMPYGDLTKQICQRFEKLSDLDKHKCTIEEREEYEPHIREKTVVYAGVDYRVILSEAEKEADVILWDGGNNDIAFYQPDLLITVVDPHRPGHEISYFPGETNLVLADVVVINKIVTADSENVELVRTNIKRENPQAQIIEAASPIFVEDPEVIMGKEVLVVEDGPTLTHGGMGYGAGVVAAEKFRAKRIVDPRPWIFGEIKKTFEKYPDIGPLLPAIGYGKKQISDLEKTINTTECDSVIIATGKPDLTDIISDFLKRTGKLQSK